MRSLACVFSMVLVVALTNTVAGHLGEVHPGGHHDYFPDPIPRTPVAVGVEELPFTRGNWWSDASYFPDGSGRLLTSSRPQYLQLVTDTGNKRFLQAGESTGWEVEGMAAIEFHPGFGDAASQGYGKFYTVTYEKDSSAPADFVSQWVEPEPEPEDDHYRVLTEWTMSDINDDVFSGTSREVMRFQMRNRFHNVNDLLFDDQEMLFITVGEDNWTDHSSTLDNVFGKILRIDPLGTDGVNQKYGIPPDNPYVGEQGVAPEVYAYGFRNPWRMTIDSETGNIWAMDVGHQDIEEVDLIVPRGNYGWPVKEGTLLTAKGGPVPDDPDPVSGMTKAEELDLIDPVFQYDHTDGRTVIGGVVYRGEKIPWLQGKVVFADMGAVGPYEPHVFYGDPETGEMFVLLDHEPLDEIWGLTCNLAAGSCPMWSINEDPDGEILILGKSLMRIVPIPADFNNDGVMDAADIDLLSDHIRNGGNDLSFDADQDGDVDNDDRAHWVAELKGTYFGDADLNGQFDSSDLTRVFQAAEYEDGIVGNSSWATGDWSGNGEFGSEDLVLAFRDGGYDQGPRPAVAAVPEPSGVLLLVCGLGVLLSARCKR